MCRLIPLVTALLLLEGPAESVDRQIVMGIRSLMDNTVTDK